jgi:hypothetical protein
MIKNKDVIQNKGFCKKTKTRCALDPLLTKHDDDSMKSAIPRLAQHIHFNPYHKENNNVEINSIKSKTAKKMVDGKMKYVIKEQLIKEIHANIIEFLQKYINKHRSTEGYNNKIND